MSSRHLLLVAVVGLFSTAHAETVYVDDDASAGGDGAGGNTAYGFLADAPAADSGGGIIKIGVGQGECGTVLTPEQAVWASILEQAGAYELPDGVALRIPFEVPLTFHVVRTSAGSGGISDSQLSQALVDADTAFASMGISFCLPGATIYIDSDAFYYDIDTIEEINALRSTNPVPNTINIYFTPNLAWEGGGLCGISSPTFNLVQGIVMNNGCTGTPENPSTFPHEIGHYFDLFHTHETVFGIECVDGLNCDVAGDLICDTPADPNLGGQVTPPPDCLYTGGEPGPCPGDPPYDPDPANLMSYSHQLCRDIFSPQQDEKGLATLVNLRPELVDACDCPTTSSPRLYVKASAPPEGDGTTWESAFNDLQHALAVAACPLSPVTEIWVAAGAYTPAPPGGARGATFRLVPGVEVYGHFAGSEASIEERDLPNPAYETILSGDLNGDDGPDFAANDENSYHVTTGSGTDQTAVLDGFTITAGNANGLSSYGYGGGMYTAGGSPTVIGCTFSGNTGSYTGGGMYNTGGSSPAVENCTFSGNLAAAGGGMGNNQANPTLTGCTFTDNTAENAGGGMHNQDCSPTVVNCTMIGNRFLTPGGGSGMINIRGNAIVSNCLFAENEGPSTGVIANWDGGDPTVINCTFVGNAISGMWSGSNSHPTASNCIFWDNVGGEIVNVSGSTATVSYSDVEGGYAGIGNINADPMCVDPASGDLRLKPGSPCLDAGNNGAAPPGPDLDGNPRFVDDTCRPDCQQAPGTCGDPPVVDMGAYEFQCSSCDVIVDGNVNVQDFLMLLADWGPCAACDICPADFDGDCMVGVTDFLLLLANWGACP
ncbi:MAG: right-handed parallel beta-helix repeat-containing protein [Planctomycetota bacterium]|jgi:hypothetical protein